MKNRKKKRFVNYTFEWIVSQVDVVYDGKKLLEIVEDRNDVTEAVLSQVQVMNPLYSLQAEDKNKLVQSLANDIVNTYLTTKIKYQCDQRSNLRSELLPRIKDFRSGE